MKAAIVILNFNGAHHLEQFLPSVVENTPNWAEVIVADNGSNDDSLKFMSENYPDIRIIELPENYGFAGGYNEALKQVDAEYYALLNSDCEVTPGWLEGIVAHLDESEMSVAAQPKIKDFNKRNYFEYAGAAGGFIDKYGYPFCRGRIFNNCERDIGQHNDTREVFWASGACLVIKSKAFWAAEGFDAGLFAHMEEIDLCWRLKNMGYRVYCYPKSVVYHLGGGTLSAQSSFKTYLNFRNNLTIIVKNDYRSRYRKRLLKRMVLDGAAGIHFFFSRGPSHFAAVLKAHFRW
ncbi:MAG: glycosyltransferase family 2 protein [Flavobacteriales bacterium]|nr:glycosyltransferase family 2 protein [Flavobacteriales bacterium]